MHFPRRTLISVVHNSLSTDVHTDELGVVAYGCSGLEGTKIFFEKYFGLIAGEKYYNPAKKFSSYMP